MSRSLSGRTKFIASNVMDGLKRDFENRYPEYLTVKDRGPHKFEIRTSMRNISGTVKFVYPGELDEEGYPIMRVRYRLYTSDEYNKMGDLQKRGSINYKGTDSPRERNRTAINEVLEKIEEIADEQPAW